VPLSSELRVALFSLLVLLVLWGLLALARRLHPKEPNRHQDVPFESGLGIGSPAHPPLPISFYLLAVSFLVFELEGAFLFAWAVAFHDLSWQAVLGGMVFVLILGLGWFYERRMGGLRWP